jgi:hypothetical protein
VLDRLDTPAQVVSDLGVTLAQNPLAVALRGVETGHEGLRRSIFYRWFTDPQQRRRFVAADHDLHARNYVATLRAVHGRSAQDDPEVRELVQALLRESPDFAARWERHEVADRTSTAKRFAHPVVGELTLDCQILTSENLREQLVVFTAAPGSEDAERLELLAVVGTQELGAVRS